MIEYIFYLVTFVNEMRVEDVQMSVSEIKRLLPLRNIRKIL